MARESEKFLQAEESAEQLVQALNELKKEAVSYKSSQYELDTVRQRLVSLIDSIQGVVKDTHEAVKTLKSIGGPEILSGINSHSQKLIEHSDIRDQQYSRLRVLVFIGLSASLLSLLGIIALLIR
jgi:hypothetical protein